MGRQESVRDRRRSYEELLDENRSLTEMFGVVMVHLVGRPGTGKTTILEKILPHLTDRLGAAVIESGFDTAPGETKQSPPGPEVIRYNTGGTGSPDTAAVNAALRRLPLADIDLVIVEDTGGPDCTEDCDVGGDLKIVVAGVTDGMELTPPERQAYKKASVALINKIDLLPYEDFRLAAFIEQLIAINGTLKIFPISALNGEGIEELSISLGRMVWKKRRNIAA